MKKTTLLLSGGPDSVTLAFFLKNEGYEFDAITFLHNPRGSNEDEVNSAKLFAEKLNIKHKVFNTSNLIELYESNEKYKFSLGGAKDCIPNNLEQTPLSVHTMLLMASMYAISNQTYSLSWAVHQDDFLKITESEFEKIKYFISELISDEIGRNFAIYTPFQKYHKQDIFNMSHDYGIALDSTVSCFNSINNTPCGKCIKCLERDNALNSTSKFLIDIWQEK